MVLMQLMIGASLLFDIPSYRILAAMSAYRAREIPIGPEFASPELLFDVGAPLEDLPCGEALDKRCYLGHAVRWNGLYEEMHVVLVGSDLQKLHLISVLNFYTYVFHHSIHILIEYGTPILCRKDHVVYQYRNVVTLMHIFAHLSTLRRKRRGIQPEVI